MLKLVLLRHGESEWNKLNLFTGWSNVDLSEQGKIEAKEAGIQLKKDGFSFDVCFTSYLKRAIHTANLALEALDEECIPIIKSWKLNERHYGALQGLNKAETAAKYGEEQVHIWRRSFDISPPKIDSESLSAPKFLKEYRNIDANELPLGESLKDTISRVIPYFNDEIKPQIINGKSVIIVAHGNSLRALIKQFDGLSDGEIANINIPTGVPLVYELDEDLKVLRRYYLGNPEEVEAKKNKVKNQGLKRDL